jgi:hypothetical protein
MSSVLNVVITDAGIAEVINAQHTGTAPVVLAQVGFGRGIYTPTADQTALHDEIKRVSTIAGGVVGDNIMHIQALDSGESAYVVYEIGVYTASGTLFAVYSQPIPILYKVANASIMCVIDFVLSGVEPTAVTVGDTDYTLAPATTTNPGVVELATNGEVAEGTDTERAVTPAGVAAAYVGLSGNQTIGGNKTFTGDVSAPVFTGDLAGKIPQPTYNAVDRTKVTAGCIILALVVPPDSAGLTLYAGQTIQSNNNSSSVRVAPAFYHDNGWGSTFYGPNFIGGTFCALSSIDITAGHTAIALLMKL